MLTLTSHLGEKVIITIPDGREIIVTVTRIERTKVRIAYDADKSIRIDREKIHDLKERERS